MSTVLSPSNLALAFWAATDTGRVRKVNQDCFHIDTAINLAIVSDGVGGRKRGEVAAELACRVVREHLIRHAQERAAFISKPDALERKAVCLLMRNAVQKASAQVFEAGQDITSGEGMSCTIDVVLILNTTAFIAHVGDSRTYLLREQKVYPLTEDHTVLQEKIRRGVLTEEEAKTAKGGNILTRAVGSLPTVQVDTLTTELLPGDGLLLCSDGLTRYVNNSELPRALPNYSANAIENLVGLARARGGADNITALVISMSRHHQRINASMPTKALRKFSFLEGCTLDELRAFWNLVEVRSFAAGDTIFSEGEAADDFYLLAEGMVELHRADRCLAVIYAGEPFGGMALTAENQRTTTAIAIDECKALALRQHRFFQLIREQSPLANHMLLRMFANAVQIVQKQNIKIADIPH